MRRPASVWPACAGLLALLVVGCRQSTLDQLRLGSTEGAALILLHGYASTAEDWLQFRQTIRWPGPLVLPQAPDRTSPPRDRMGGRAWFPMDLNALTPAGELLPDLTTIRPAGLDVAATRIIALVKDEDHRGGPPVLAGFSQGAMVAAHVAFTSNAPLAGLVLLSGTPVASDVWRRGYAARRGLPVLVTHGRTDDVLSEARARQMADEMTHAGLDVTWMAFGGGHEMPSEAVAALNAFLVRLRERDTR